MAWFNSHMNVISLATVLRIWKNESESLSVVSDSLWPHRLYSWRKQWQPTLVLLPGKSHGRRSLVGCSPWGCYELDMTEPLHFHFSPSCVGEGNGNPLQCSCLENPKDGRACWATLYGVAQSRTRLKRFSSSSRLYNPWNSPGQNTRVGILSLLQWLFLTQELNQSLQHCRRILYQLSYKGSPENMRKGIHWETS